MTGTCQFCHKPVTGQQGKGPYHETCYHRAYVQERERLPKIHRKLKQLEKLLAEIKALVR